MVENQSRETWNKNIFIVVAFLIVAIGGFATWYKNRIQVYDFAGSIEKIEGDVVTLKGTYQSDSHPEIGGPEHELQASVTITPQTKITKVVLQMPSWAELDKNGGFFHPADLPKVSSDGSLQDISDLHIDGLFIKTTENIYGKNKFNASEVTYYDRTQPQ